MSGKEDIGYELASEETILKFLQLPEQSLENLRQISKDYNLDWIMYLNQLYREFHINK